jgi:hypothetical protein
MRLGLGFVTWSSVLGLVLLGCESSSGSPEGNPAQDAKGGGGDDTATAGGDTGGNTTGTDTATSPPEGPAAAEVTTPQATVEAEPAPPEVNYPEGPYGTDGPFTGPDGLLVPGDQLANLEFYDPLNDRTVMLADYYNDPGAILLFIVSSAGWCKPCQKTSKDLQTYYEQWGVDGLRILYTMREDWDGNPLYVGPQSETYSLKFMNEWMTTLGPFTYELAVDGDGNGDGAPDVLGPYYTQGSIPFVMGVKLKPGSTTKAMEIIYKDHGESVAFIQYQVSKYLYGGN